MKLGWKSSLGLSLGLLLGGAAHAQMPAQPAGGRPTLDRPVTVSGWKARGRADFASGGDEASSASGFATGRAGGTTAAGPAVSLDRPVPISLGRPRALPTLEGPVQPVAHLGFDAPGTPNQFGTEPPRLLPGGEARRSDGLELAPSPRRVVETAPPPAQPAIVTQGDPLANPLGWWGAGHGGAAAPGGYLADPTSDSCAIASCGGQGCCEPPSSRFYARAEYLLWWIRAANTPPLVTTSTDPNAANNPLAGVLGQPGTVVLFGGGETGYDPFSGFRLYAGYLFGPCGGLALEGGFFNLGTRSNNFTATSPGFPTLYRPFFNIAPINGGPGQEDVQLVAVPGVLAGSINVSQSLRLWGAEANLRRPIIRAPFDPNAYRWPGLDGSGWGQGGCGCNACTPCDPCQPCFACKFDLLAGFRFLGLDESLTIQEDLFPLPQAGVPVDFPRIQVTDRFATSNRFYGGQIGAETEFRWRRLSLGLSGKLGIGGTQQRVTISGQTVATNAAGMAIPFPGGLLTTSTNIGVYNRTMFTFVPEAGLTIGYQVLPRLRLTVGYNFLYWSSVVRPGNQIDRAVNPFYPAILGNMQAGNPLPVRPAFAFNGSDFWAQGLTFGLELRF